MFKDGEYITDLTLESCQSLASREDLVNGPRSFHRSFGALDRETCGVELAMV